MRIAVPMAAGVFSAHFGQSAFWACDVTEDPATIANGRELAVSGDGGCGSISPMLAAEGVKLVIAGGMGAVVVRWQIGIQVILGVAGGTPREVVEQYLAGELVASGQVLLNTTIITIMPTTGIATTRRSRDANCRARTWRPILRAFRPMHAPFVCEIEDDTRSLAGRGRLSEAKGPAIASRCRSGVPCWA